MTHLMIASLALCTGSWTLNAPVEKDWKQVLKIHITADVSGSQHEADATQTVSLADTGITKIAWTGVEVDGNTMDDLPVWTFASGKQGEITAAKESLEDDYRRMFAPITFVYPNKAVSVGDEWEAHVGTMDYKFTAKVEEKVNSVDVIAVKVALKEAKGTVSADGTWWLDKDGKVTKYDIKIHGWVVPFAGPEAAEATVTGKA